MRKQYTFFAQPSIRIAKPSNSRLVIATAEIVQSEFRIIDVPAIAEWIVLAQRIRKRAGGREQLTSCIVLVFYNKVAAVVKDSHNISLEIVEVDVGRAVEVYIRGTGLRIIEEVHLVIADGHVGDELAVERIVGGFRLAVCGHFLLYAQTCGIILEFNRLGRLTVVNPCICTD